MGRFLWLMNTPGAPPDFLHKLTEHRFDVVQQYEMDRAEFGDYDGIITGMHSDQRHLASLGDRLGAYIDAGGALIFSGHVSHPFLPGLTPFRPVEQKGLESLRIHLETPHPLTEGLTSDHLTFQRTVAGFYGRGGNPPPPGATVLASVGFDRVPVDWIERRGKGWLYVHCGNDLWAHYRRADPEGLGHLRRVFDFFAGATV
ncbi:hypothetical protein [Psychromarinibacter sp. S121]|uniref:hypothetical protein n=1 Tax=Psychromarinibacter sp. S121 TaxID=3415127 RepID=UPI003C7D045D